MIETWSDLLELIKSQPLTPKERFYLAWFEYQKGNLPWRYVQSLCPYLNTPDCPFSNTKKDRCPWGYHLKKRCFLLFLSRKLRKTRTWYRKRY